MVRMTLKKDFYEVSDVFLSPYVKKVHRLVRPPVPFSLNSGICSLLLAFLTIGVVDAFNVGRDERKHDDQ